MQRGAADGVSCGHLRPPLGLTLRNWIVWHYTFGVSCTRKFNRSHAHIFYYVADPKRFTFNADAVRVPSARQTTYADRRANPAGKVPDDTWVLRPQEDDRFFGPQTDTWYVPWARPEGTVNVVVTMFGPVATPMVEWWDVRQ